MKQVSERWFVDENGYYYLRTDTGYIFYGTPQKESEVIKKIENGKLALEVHPISVIDGKKIYHVYNPNVLPIPHFDILVEEDV
jgi:hypothetical protein